MREIIHISMKEPQKAVDRTYLNSECTTRKMTDEEREYYSKMKPKQYETQIKGLWTWPIDKGFGRKSHGGRPKTRAI